MSHYFITASGTGVGKTLVTCALAYQLKQQGRHARVLKPIISGFDAANPTDSDTVKILEASGLEVVPGYIHATSPWRYEAPLAPALAAAREQKTIRLEQVIHYCSEQEAGTELLLVEGVGGVMTPIDAQYTVLDWISALQYQVLLVGGTYLGSVGHTLAAYELLRMRGLDVKALIVSESEASNTSLQETVELLRSHVDEHVLLFPVARIAPGPRPWERTTDMTGVI